MKNTKHTPGPWKFVIADLVKSECGITYHEVYGSNSSVVARRVISDADARVIAAAPELLDWLKAVVRQMELERPKAEATYTNGETGLFGMFSGLKKVIAKAEEDNNE